MSGSVIARAADEAALRGFDAFIASSPENVAYLLGYMMPSLARPKRTRLITLVVNAAGSAVCVVPLPEAEEAASRSPVRDIRLYNEYSDDPTALIAEALSELGCANGVVGLETDVFPHKHYAGLASRLPRCSFGNCTELFSRLRMVKTVQEADTLRQIGRIVDQAFQALPTTVRLGMSEIDANYQLSAAILRGGAEGIDRFLVGSGPRTGFTNSSAPTTRAMAQGDLLRIDAFAHHGFYRADIARTFAVGRVLPEFADLWSRLVDLHSGLISMLKPGVSIGEIFAAYSAHHSRLGLEPAGGVPLIGHGIGLTVHERPYIDARSDDILQEGMVLCIESLHLSPPTGLQLEDEVLITADGVEHISDGRNGGRLPALHG